MSSTISPRPVVSLTRWVPERALGQRPAGAVFATVVIDSTMQIEPIREALAAIAGLSFDEWRYN
ncbi:MAG: hypothetical protein WKF65_09785 [Gaiellaceae bacterium]